MASPQSQNLPALMACPTCDLLLVERPLSPGQIFRCPRCQFRLHKEKTDSIDKCLAISVSGLLLFTPAILMPLFTFRVMGMQVQANLIQAVATLFQAGYGFVALMVLLTSILFPLAKLALLFLISLSLHLTIYFPLLTRLFRWYIHMEEWGMVDVYLIGIMVTLIKMLHTAEISYELGFFSFFSFVLLSLAAQVVMDRRLFWRAIEARQTQGTPVTVSTRADVMASLPSTALAAGLLHCHDCGKLLETPPSDPPGRLLCSRCGASLHARKHNSLNRTWALILAAALLFIPANILPIMRVDFLGLPSSSTILDGIIYFFEEGSYGIGVIILTASVLVPLFKIAGMSIILLSIRFRRFRYLRQKTWMYRFIVFIGRWSMLDIFVIALLGALVQFGFFSTIQPAPAATWFTLVVILSMSAAISFDPRLLWDILPQPGKTPSPEEAKFPETGAAATIFQEFSP